MIYTLEDLSVKHIKVEETTKLHHLIKYYKEYDILYILIKEKPKENYRHLHIITKTNMHNCRIVDTINQEITAESCLAKGYLVRKHGKSSWEIFFNQ